MMVAARHQEKLPYIKKCVKESHDAFKDNYDRFNEFRRFVYESSLTPDEVSLLMTLSRPQLDFPILPAYISRLLGEFSKQEPSIEVSSDDETNADPTTVQVVDQHLRHILFDSKNHHTKFEVYKDLLSGGFSVFKVTTDYAHPMSFKQNIEFDRVFDPTLCGFDQLARRSHKGDGRFCFELFPMGEERFKEEYPGVPLDKLNFRRDFAGFNWSYLNGNEKIIIVGDFYEKKSKEVTIVELRNGKVMTKKDYEDMLINWKEFTAPPAIIGKPRKTQIETICRYRMMETMVLEYEETDFTFLPLIFVDGDSIMLKTPKNGNVRQFTKPYVYHAKSAQRLKNYAGIALANEIENTVQHKFMVAKEALPKEEEFLEAYKDVQKASVMVYNSVYEQDPDKPILNPIREIQRVGAPPEIMQGFTSVDSLVQMVLGSYDASLGINDNQLSGIAVVESATQSNAAAMPYIVGFLQGLQRVAEIIVNLIPKYYKTPRTIPIQDSEGKKQYIKINQPGGVEMDYDENVLNVKVEAGASFAVQKSRAMSQLIAAMQANPQFAQFFSEKGLRVFVDNMDMRGLDQVKILAEDWMAEQAQMKQQMMQMQQQQAANDPQILKAKNEAMKLQLEAQRMQQDAQNEQQHIMVDQAKIRAQLVESMNKVEIEKVKAATEIAAKREEFKIQRAEHHLNVHNSAHQNAVAWHVATKPEPKRPSA